MDRAEFVERYVTMLEDTLNSAEKARREGILALEQGLDREKADERDIFVYGLSFVVDGTDSALIEKILSNIIAQEKDEYSRILKTIQKEAVLGIQEGLNPRILVHLLTSYTDIPLNDEKLRKLLKGLL
jgi:flagellar motor component MotA